MNFRPFVFVLVFFFSLPGTRASDFSFSPPLFDIAFLEATGGPFDPGSNQCDALLRTAIQGFRFSDQELEFSGHGILAQRDQTIQDLVRRIRWIFGQEMSFPEASWTPVTPENEKEQKVVLENLSYNRFLNTILQNWMDVLLKHLHSTDPETYFPSRKNHLKQAHFQEASPHGILIATPPSGKFEQMKMIQMLQEERFRQVGRIFILDPDSPIVRPDERFLNEATRVLIGETSDHEPFNLISRLPAFKGVKRVFLTGASPGRYLFSPNVPLEPDEVNNQLRSLMGSAHTLEIHLPVHLNYIFVSEEYSPDDPPESKSPHQFHSSPRTENFKKVTIALAIQTVKSHDLNLDKILSGFFSRLAFEVFPFLEHHVVTWDDGKGIVKGEMLVDGKLRTLKVVFPL